MKSVIVHGCHWTWSATTSQAMSQFRFSIAWKSSSNIKNKCRHRLRERAPSVGPKLATENGSRLQPSSSRGSHSRCCHARIWLSASTAEQLGSTKLPSSSKNPTGRPSQRTKDSTSPGWSGRNANRTSCPKVSTEMVDMDILRRMRSYR